MVVVSPAAKAATRRLYRAWMVLLLGSLCRVGCSVTPQGREELGVFARFNLGLASAFSGPEMPFSSCWLLRCDSVYDQGDTARAAPSRYEVSALSGAYFDLRKTVLDQLGISDLSLAETVTDTRDGKGEGEGVYGRGQPAPADGTVSLFYSVQAGFSPYVSTSSAIRAAVQSLSLMMTFYHSSDMPNLEIGCDCQDVPESLLPLVLISGVRRGLKRGRDVAIP